MSTSDTEGVDYLPSAFGNTFRWFPDLHKLVIEELDFTRPPGKHRIRGGYAGYDEAKSAYNKFWSRVSGDHRRTIVWVQIWGPVGNGLRKPEHYILRKTPEDQWPRRDSPP